jgi:hypothetical protein
MKSNKAPRPAKVNGWHYVLSKGCEMNKQWSCIIRRLTCLIPEQSGGLGVFQFAVALTFLWYIAFFHLIIYELGVRGGAVGWGTLLQAWRSRFRLPVASSEFFIDIILRPHYGSEVDSASNRNGYQEHFLVCKRGRCVWLHVPIVLKSVSLNLLEPSGTVQACNGIAFILRAHRLAPEFSLNS